MIHAYRIGEQYLVLDVDTGSVHMLDKLSYEVVMRYESMTEEETAEDLKGDFTAEEVAECRREVAALVRAGQLFTSVDFSAEAPAEEPGALKALCLHVSHDCDLRCKYCFAESGSFHGSRSFMSADVGKKALDFLFERSGDRKFLEVDFFGGEPLLNLDVVKQIVAHGRRWEEKTGKVIRFTITTNAVSLDTEAMDYLNREMFNVVLSLDGRRHVHDAMRPTAGGMGSFDRALANSKAMVALRGDKSYYVRGTFTRENMDFANDVISLVNEGFEHISIEPVVLTPESPLSLLPEHLPLISAEYERLMRLYLLNRQNGRPFHFFHFYVDVSGGPCLKRRLSGCGSGTEYLAVTPEGDLYPCHQFVGREGFRMGSVLTGELDESMRQRFAKNHALNKAKCRDCWAKYYCCGGCAANAHQFTGDIMTPYDMECALEKKRLECALMIYAQEHLDQAQE